jgi:tetratricopeptide (TPR) repeat protein
MGVAYALAQVKAPADRSARMKFVTNYSALVRVNGEVVHTVDRLRERLPRTATMIVPFRAGWNRILVKSGGRFSCKLDGEFEVEEGLVLHEAAAPAGPVTPVADAPMPGEGPFATAAAAILDSDDVMLKPEALAGFRRAAEAAPREAAVQHLLGEAYRRADHLPEVYRSNRAKLAFQAALEADPGFTPSAVSLATLEHADDKSEEAVRDLRALLETHPDHLPAWDQIARIALDKGWEKEALGANRRCLSIHSSFRPAVERMYFHHDRYDNPAEARKLLLRAVEANRANYWALDRLADYDAAAGKRTEAIARLRRICELRPGDTGSLLTLARALRVAGETDEAKAILLSLEARYPLDPRYPRRIGDLLRRTGDVAGAIASYERCLALAPAQGALQQHVDRLAGREVDFARPYEPEVLDLVKGAPGREEFPRAPAVCLLDHMVSRFWPDGSSTEIVHMAYKLLDEKGVEAFGRVDTAGETLEVRTIDPEGKVFEPLGVRRNSYNMPALAPGSVVEYRFRMDNRRDPRWLDTEPFYFRDPEFDNAVLLSRWVVIVPKSLRLEVMKRNYRGKHEVVEEGDMVVHTFEVRNSPRTEQELYMPDGDDFLPWVRLVRNRPKDDLNFIYADRLWRDLAPTPRIVAEAARVTEGIESDLDKARALHDHVNEVVTGGGGFGGPTATLLEKAGDSLSLFASLCLAAGVEFEFGMACPDRGADIEWEIVDPGMFYRKCMRIRGGDGPGAWVFFLNRFMPFGRVPDRYRDSPVLVVGREQGRIETLPAGADGDRASVTRTAIRLAEDAAETRVEVAFFGDTDFGYLWKENLRDRDADERRQQLERALSARFTGPVLEDFALEDLDEAGTPIRVRATATLPNYLRAEGAEFRAGLGLQPLELAARYVGKPERIHPMEIRQEGGTRSVTTIELGDAWRVVRLPPGHATMGPLGSYSLSVTGEDGRIVVRRDVRMRRCRITPDEYREFVRWVKAIDEAEERKIVLARAE